MRDDVLLIHEIYRSVQGESSFAGLPCTFVRTTGCNLRCHWCDTPQAFHGGRKLSVDEVRQQALALATPLVEITGGEPLLQPAVLPLMRALCDAGKTVLLETSGERDIRPVDPRVHRILDLKAPGSGESHRVRWDNLAHLTLRDEIKIVLRDEADYRWAGEVIQQHGLADRAGQLLLSPVHGALAPADLVSWVLRDRLPVRINLQLHKYIWGADAQGV